MPGSLIIRRPSRRDPAVAEAVRSFRALTGGRAVKDRDRATLVAVSGGADSSALVLALATTKAPLMIGHVVHDLRPPHESLADRDRVRELAEALGIGFLERSIEVREMPGNPESVARRLRYAALAEMAARAACPYVAVAHHADDQAETVLMRLLRGSGARGLGAMAPTRPLSRAVTLIRPILGVARSDTQRLCTLAGWPWQEDATNTDTTRLRAALRHEILPVLRRLAPGAVTRIGVAARLLRDAAGLVDERVAVLRAHGQVSKEGGPMTVDFRREILRAQPEVVIGELLRSVVREVSGGRGADRLTSRPVMAAVRAIRGDGTDPRRLCWRSATILVTAHSVSVRGAAADEAEIP